VRQGHPNILALHGWALNIKHEVQYLVYTLTDNGSLATFLRKDCNRALLTPSIRLSILFDVTRVVRYLHNGECQGQKMFHRDIQSATIWLSEDFTPKLMDYGLSKLIHLIRNANTKPSSSSSSSSSSAANASSPFGTRRYMCPEYLNNTDPDHYEAGYDVYSIGVLIVELILGTLDFDSSSPDDCAFFDVLRDSFSECEEGNQIKICREWLKDHVDPTIVWDVKCLDKLCDAAIGCLTPITPTGGRMTTKDLMDTLMGIMHLDYVIKLHTALWACMSA
jgi:serine/threonine protein kinase